MPLDDALKALDDVREHERQVSRLRARFNWLLGILFVLLLAGGAGGYWLYSSNTSSALQDQCEAIVLGRHDLRGVLLRVVNAEEQVPATPSSVAEVKFVQALLAGLPRESCSHGHVRGG